MTRKKLFFPKLNVITPGKHLIDDDSDYEENENIDWSSESEQDNKEEINEDEVVVVDLDSEELKDLPEPEVSIEVIEHKKAKAVKFNIEMALDDDSNNILNLEFIINKDTFLKIAKELK
jgi:hypothetical protein